MKSRPIDVWQKNQSETDGENELRDMEKESPKLNQSTCQ